MTPTNQSGFPAALLLLIGGILLYLIIHFQTGAVEPIVDDWRMLDSLETLESWTDCFRPGYYEMFRPTKSLIFYFVYANHLPFETMQWIGALLSVLCTTLAYAYLLNWFSSRVLCAVGALVWLFLPVNLAIFNWASALNIALYFSFILATLLTFDSAHNQSGFARWVRFGLSALFGSAALISYELALPLPMLLLVDAALRRQRQDRLFLVKGITLHFALVGLFLFVRQHYFSGATNVIPENPAIGPHEAWMLPVVSSISYLSHWELIAFPFRGFSFLAGIHPAGLIGWAILAWISLLLTLIFSIKVFRSFPYLLFALLWSAFALFPILNVIPIGSGPIAEYYTSIPALSWITVLLGLMQVTKSIPIAKRGVIPVIAVLGLGYVISTTARQGVWRSDPDLFLAAASRPGCHFAKAQTAQSDLQAGQLEFARFWIEAAMDEAPWEDAYVVIWLSVLGAQGIPADTLHTLTREALRAFPGSAGLHSTLGDLEWNQGHPDLAEQAYLQARSLAINADELANALNNLGILEAGYRQNYAEAIAYFEAALIQRPDHREARANLQQARADLVTQDNP